MTKLDFRKTEPAFFCAPAGTFAEVDLPPRRYLMIDGQGDPNTVPAYKQALEALFTTAYALKFASKKQLNTDYVVPPPESLWWAEGDGSIMRVPKDAWQWTTMIMVPDFIPEEMVPPAQVQASAKKKLPALEKLHLSTLSENHAVQTLFIGSYLDGGPVLQEMHTVYMPAHKLRCAGRHHEIYLSDPRRTAPEKCRTLLRQPVMQA